MSMTGQLQAIKSRGYSLQWSQASANHPHYATLVVAILDRAGVVVARDSRAIKVRGSVVTKESEEVQRAAQIAWAEEVTRHPLAPLRMDPPEREVAQEPVLTVEEKPHGEEVSVSVPNINTVEAQADDPV